MGKSMGRQTTVSRLTIGSLCAIGMVAAGVSPATAAKPPGADLIVVLEDSEEAARRDPAGARWRAVDMMRDLLSPDDRIGVVSYGKHARMAKPLTAPKEGMPPGGWGWMPEGKERDRGKSRPMVGVAKALEALEKDGRPGVQSNILLVMSGDPATEQQSAVDDVVARAQRQGVAVYGFRRPKRSASAQEELLVKGTGGTSERFKEERQLPMMWQTWFDRWRSGGGASLTDRRIPVDDAVKQLRLVAKTDNPELVVVSSPDGKRIKASKNNPDGVLWSDTAQGALIVVDNPTPGTWRIDAKGAPVRGWIESDLALIATVPSGTVLAGAPVMISAFLANGGARVDRARQPAGVTISASIPNSKDTNAHLRDDGVGSDRKAADGEFWGSMAAPRSPGEHDVVVRASAPGFYRRAIATIQVTVGEEAPVETPDETAMPALVVAPKPFPRWIFGVLGGLLLSMLVVGLVWRLRVRAASQTVAAPQPAEEEEEIDPELAPMHQSSIDGTLLSYLARSGVTNTSMPSEGPPGKPNIMILDFDGDFEARIREVIGGALTFQRVVDARSCRQQIRNRRPALLIICDPVKGATVPALLRCLQDDTGITALPVVRVAKKLGRKALTAELNAGVHDILLESESGDAHSEAGDLLRRVARALRSHGEIRAERLRQIAPVRKIEKVDLDWVTDRIADVPVPLKIVADVGADGWEGEDKGMLVEVSAEGFSVAAKSLSDDGFPFGFESELFASLALDLVRGEVARVRQIEDEKFPYLWDVRYSDLDAVHRQRILSCYQGLVHS